MSECTPHSAAIVALLLLGTLFAVGASLLGLFYGVARRSKPILCIGATIVAALLADISLYCAVFLSEVKTNRFSPPGEFSVDARRARHHSN
jgi:hypothetical protein